MSNYIWPKHQVFLDQTSTYEPTFNPDNINQIVKLYILQIKTPKNPYMF